MALTIKLEWDPSTSLDVVNQEVHTKFDGIDQESVTVGPDATSLEISTEQGVEVTWFVRSIDDAENFSDSDPTIFTAEDTFPPLPATNLRVTVIGET